MSPVTTNAALARIESALGAEFVRTSAAELAGYAIDGVFPSLVARPENTAQISEIVKLAIEEKLTLIPCGACSAVDVGMPPTAYDIALDMTRLTGIASYDPGDLTISVNAGMPLAELARELAAKNQFLPLETPFFRKATIGGAIAAGLDSPLRHGYGAPRDFMIGAEFVDGTGAQAKSGGRVVKNVTGYDFHKLMNGSLGTLAIVTRLNFRTYPLPAARRGSLASFAEENGALEFLKAIASSALTPIVLEMLSPECAGVLFQNHAPFAAMCAARGRPEWAVCVGFEGTAEVCDRYARELTHLARTTQAQNAVVLHDEHFTTLMEILREAPVILRDISPQSVVMRFSTLPAQLADLLRALHSFAGSSWMAAPVLVRSGSVVYLALTPRSHDEYAGKQLEYFWKSVGSLRSKLEFRGALLFCPPDWKTALNVWQHVDFDLDMERRVKRAFDPHGVFARARFVGGI